MRCRSPTNYGGVLSSGNIEDGARLDIAANGLWGGKCGRTFLDEEVINPHAPSNHSTNPQGIYTKHENAKKCSYEARICEVKHGSFTPLILSSTGGMANEAHAFYKRLASLLCMKRSEPFAALMGWLYCCLPFSLLRSAFDV